MAFNKLNGINSFLKIENRAPFGADQVFEPDPERERQINAEPQPGGHEGNIDKENTYAAGAHAELVGEPGCSVETVLFKKIFQPYDKRHLRLFRRIIGTGQSYKVFRTIRRFEELNPNGAFKASPASAIFIFELQQ
jgi:hypothetical protein